MHATDTVARLALVSLLAGSGFSQEGLSSDAGPRFAGPLAASVFSSSHGLATVGGELYGIGSGYEAHFRSGGVRFLPALGPTAPRTFPLDLSLDSIRRGDALLHEAFEATQPAFEGDEVQYTRGASITERYDVRAEGVYQSFVFEEPLAGRGDLVVRLRLSTELEAVAAPDGGFSFERTGLGGVRYGAVQGIDADGYTASGELRVEGSYLELVLPDAFVSEAAYPLILDPLIGAQQSIVAGASDDRDPEVGYGGGVNLVVWERVFAFDHIDLLAQRVDLSGAPTGPLIPLVINGSNEFAYNPSVGFATATGRFLVAWAGQDFTDFREKVFCATIDTAGNASAIVELAPSMRNKRAPKVGGNRSGVGSDCLVVWDEPGAGVVGQIVQATGGGPLPVGPLIVCAPDNLAYDVLQPCVSHSSDGSNPFLVAWTAKDFGLLNVNDFIQARTVSVTGSLGSIAWVTSPSSNDSGYPSCDGAGENFLIAWEQDEMDPSVDVHDLRARHVKLDGTDLVLGPIVDVEVDANDDEIDVQLAYAWNSTVVVYRDETAISGDYDLYAKSMDPFNASLAPGETFLNASGNDTSSVAVAARRSAGASDQSAYIVWQEDVVGGGDLWGVRWDSPGLSKDFGGDCGLGGISYNPCPIAGNSDFTLHLQGSTPNVTAVLVTAGAMLPVVCGPCTLVPNVESVYFQTTDACGNASQTIPLSPAMTGLTFYSQWATFLTPGNGACPLAPLDFSNALRTTVD